MDALHLLLLILIHGVVLQTSETGNNYVAMARFLEAHPADTELMAAASNQLLEQMKLHIDRVGNHIWNPRPQAGVGPGHRHEREHVYHVPPSSSSPKVPRSPPTLPSPLPSPPPSSSP